jgi:hypothetical protein
MPQSQSPTRDQITALINQIVTGGDYTANELRLLLSDILGSLYSPFYNLPANPTSQRNQTDNYKANSLGKNSSTGRYFVCSSSTATTATWEQISLDKGYQAIVGVASTAYQVSSNTSIVNFSGSQNNVTINLPTAANSYQGKVVRINFSSPAQTSGSGVTFAVPELSPVTLLAANIYTSNAFVEFTFSGTGWILTQYVPTVADFGYQSIAPVEGSTATMSKDTYLLNIVQPFAPASFTAYNVLLPADPYFGKVCKIQTNVNVTSITTLTIKRSDGVTVASGAIGPNQAVEFIYGTNAWTKVAPTIIW